MRAIGNEADIAFLTNEKTVIFNNSLSARIGQLARNSMQLDIRSPKEIITDEN